MNDMVFFFSYARKDAEKGKDCLLEEFYRDLDSRIGARLAKNLPCSYKDTKMDTGMVWPTANIKAMQTCPLLVFILSPYYQNSNFGGKELAVYLQRREQMLKTFPNLPNLIFPVRWISLKHSGIVVPDSINHLNCSNYGMDGDIINDGFKKLGGRDRRYYHRFLDGLAEDMLDALDKLEKEIPDYRAHFPIVPSIHSISSAFSNVDKEKTEISEDQLDRKKPIDYEPEHEGSSSNIVKWMIWILFFLLLGAAGIYLLFYYRGQALIFGSGAANKSFTKLFGDMNIACGESIPLKEMNTTGGKDNLDALTAKTAHIGLVTTDVYRYMEETDPGIGRFKVMLKLMPDLLHILALKSGYQIITGRVCQGKEVAGKCLDGQWKPVYQTKVIQNESDLIGLTVATVGSVRVTARRYLNNELNMKLNIVDVADDAQAFADLKAGKVQAVLTLAAFPSGTIEKLTSADGITLVNWKSGATGEYKTTKRYYKNLGYNGVTFLSSPIILVARPVDPKSKIGRKISGLKACIIANLDRLKDGQEFESSWSEVSNPGMVAPLPPWEDAIP
jgi:ABC-type amino acid transport substrate-binding protein